MNRIHSVDLFKFIAIIGVIIAHTAMFEIDSTDVGIKHYINVFTNHLGRFIIPFFFTVSGFFWGVKIRSGYKPLIVSLYTARRIGIILIAWCIIYLLPYNISAFYEFGIFGPLHVAYLNLISLIQDPLTLLMEGTKVHLWFLIALLYSLVICTFFVYKKWTKGLIICSLALYLFGVLAKAYVNTPIGIDIDFDTRNGPFFGTLPFATGFLISGFKPKNKWLIYGIFVFSFGLISHFSELYILRKLYNTSLNQDYVFGTYFMGLGVAVLALSNHPSLHFEKLSNIGRMTLGIYAMHFIFIDIFHIIDKNVDSLLWDIAYVLIVLVLSLLLSKLLSLNKYTKKIVM